MSAYWPVSLYPESKLRKEFGEHGFWKDDYKLLVITDKQGSLIGEVDCFNTSPNIQGSEVGYRIFRKRDMGKGLMTEALKLFTSYLFKSAPLMLRLTALIRSDNSSSINVAEKCGFQHEGTLRNAWIDDGVPFSMEIYSLLRNECPKLPELLQKS